ncbi:hypothetical protein Tco_0319034 [Tanacetum coccineum]
MEGIEITKQECEPMLYDEFDKFTSEHRESIHSYYPRYAKMINDMNIIPMYMSNMHINMKFVNHLQPKWRRGEDHIAKHCTTKKRMKNTEWLKDKMLLAQAQEVGVVLNEDQHDFLVDRLEENDDCDDLQLHTIANFKAGHVDTYDLDCDDQATASAIFMYMVTIQDEADHYVPPLLQNKEMMLYIIDQMKSQVEHYNTVNQEA